jgi:primosomal protein N' (replication factor Y)
VLGARSAVFAPIPDGQLGLIIVDEEHDGSYKQDQAPRYQGRDVAIRRAQLAGCPIILGSATPSLESWHNATQRDGGRYALHRLRQRAPGLRLPKVQVVDFREQARQRRDNRVHLLGPILESAIARTLDGGGQVLILLNRRGYANYIACPSSRCGWMLTCDHCDVTMVHHRDKKLPAGEGYVRCHHCLSEQKLPAICPQCGNKISIFGLGTQRIEEELARKFPQLVQGQTMLRIDSDTMRGAAAFHDALGRFGTGEIRLMLGTQMIAKGLDFPGVRLVGVINADTSINLPDFRASERTFQLVNQVAGRAGRGDDPGLTIVQTFNPSSPAIRLAAAHDYEGFAQQELAEREQSGLPPVTRMARIVIRDEDHIKCIEAARGLARGLTEIINQTPGDRGGVHVRGPAPCPISRIADKHRHQIEILAPTAALMQGFLTKARSAGLLKSGTEMAIDVDPIALL